METFKKLRQKPLVCADFVRVNVHRLIKVIGKQLIKIQELGSRKPWGRENRPYVDSSEACKGCFMVWE